jgi:outer membrane protein assembly factor BamB
VVIDRTDVVVRWFHCCVALVVMVILSMLPQGSFNRLIAEQLDPVNSDQSVLKPTVVHRKPKPLADGAITSDWTNFFGPTHNGVTRESPLLKTFPEEGPGLVWEMPTGSGYAVPAVYDGRVFYLQRMGNQEVVCALNAVTGKPLWEFGYPTDYSDNFGYSNGPRCPPVIDPPYLYTYGAQGKLHCLQLETGNRVWSRDLMKDYRLKQNYFGVGDTPLVDGDKVIVNLGAPQGPSVLALDKRTGKTIWGSGKSWSPGYSSPIPALIHGKRRVLVFSGGESAPADGGLMSIDLENGAMDFRFPWRSRSSVSVNAASPVVAGNRIFVSASYRTGGAMLEVKPDFSFELLWKSPDLGTHWTTAIHKDGYLYGFHGRHEPEATLVCLELETGKVMWREQILLEESVEIGGSKQDIPFVSGRASLLVVDGNVLCLGEWGHLVWLDLSPVGVQILSRTWLTKSRYTWGMPVLSQGLLYINQNERSPVTGTEPRLLCYDLRGS